MKLTFLSAAVPLTKTITPDPKTSKSYPKVTNLTSHEEEVKNLLQFHQALSKHALKGECLLKGNLNQALKNEPRRDHHEKEAHTMFVCFDLDGAPFTTANEFMKAIGLDDVSYIIQYSSSYKLKPNKTFNGHIFAMLEQPLSPKNLEAWLMHLNFSTPVLEKSLSLTNSLEYLSFPLDIVCARNSQIIYIAPPVLKGIKAPLKDEDRIQLVKKTKDAIGVNSIELKPIAALKEKVREKITALRVALNLKPNKSKIKIVGDMEIQPNATEVSLYEIIEENDEFTRLNLNGGDSGAYWYFNSDFEVIRNFKGEPFTYMKDTLPDLYKKLQRQARSSLASTSMQGDMVLAVRDKATGEYWKGLFNAEAQNLDIHRIDAKDKLHDFLQGHGVPPPPFIPEWQVIFDPRIETIVDEDERIINRFVPTKLMRDPKAGEWPTIQKFINHAVGTGQIQEHFLNWLAVIIQHRIKTKTAWILHGTQGTGKGVLVNKVLRAIFEHYVECIGSDALNSEFNAFMEKSLLVFIDEIDVDVFERKATENKLRSYITDSPLQIRRMRTDGYNADNFSNFIFASNHAQPVRIPLSDRRTNVGVYQPHRLISTHNEVEYIIPKEVPAFAQYLLTRKACIDTAAQVLKTDDRAAIQALSITSVDELANDIVNGNLDALIAAMPDENLPMESSASVYASLIRSFALLRPNNISRDQLKVIFEHCIGKVPEGANKFTSFLRHHGIHTKKIKVDGVSTWGINVDWKVIDISQFQQQQPKLRKVK